MSYVSCYMIRRSERALLVLFHGCCRLSMYSSYSQNAGGIPKVIMRCQQYAGDERAYLSRELKAEAGRGGVVGVGGVGGVGRRSYRRSRDIWRDLLEDG